MDPSKHAVSQYATTSTNLSRRLGLHVWTTESESWYSWVRHRLPKTGRLLEIGAGTGELWRQPDHDLNDDLELVLTDFSAAMCDELRATVPSASSVRQCDAARLDGFGDATFDNVVANHMLYHVDDPDAALREFARVLRPGGRVFVALNGEDHLPELFRVGEAIGRPSTIRRQARVRIDTAANFLGRHFVDISSERAPGAFEVPEPGPVLEYLSTIGEGGPLNAEEEKQARKAIEAVIADKGTFHIGKSMYLFTASLPQ